MMQRVPTPVQIFLAVFSGAFVGTLIALQMTPVLWWIGLLAGGLVGYLSYQPMQVIKAIPQAGRVAWSATCKSTRWLILAIIVVLFFPALFLVWAFYMGLFWSTIAGVLPMIDLASVPFPAFFLGGFLALFHSFWVADNSYHRFPHTYVVVAIKQASPFRVFGWILRRALPKVLIWTSKIVFYHLPITLWLLAKSFGIFVKTFSVTLFKLVYSQERLLCLVFAVVGTAIGFSLHNALAGALIGGVFGVINYELVSKRWLKLVPKRG